MIGPIKLHALLTDAAKRATERLVPPANLIDAIVSEQMLALSYELDPDHRLEECEECGKCDTDLLMEETIEDKHVCYDCYLDLGGEDKDEEKTP